MDERYEWEAERNQVIRAQQLAREEQAEVRADAARMAEVEARRDAAWDAARRTGRPVPTHGDILARARESFEATEDRDAATAYGSQSRPAMFVTAADGSLVEMTGRQRATVGRSVSDAWDDDLLRQARESSANSYMRVQIARAASRRKHEAAGETEVSRSGEWDGGYREISR